MRNADRRWECALVDASRACECAMSKPHPGQMGMQ
jgi:hypothetical protein